MASLLHVAVPAAPAVPIHPPLPLIRMAPRTGPLRSRRLICLQIITVQQERARFGRLLSRPSQRHRMKLWEGSGVKLFRVDGSIATRMNVARSTGAGVIANAALGATATPRQYRRHLAYRPRTPLLPWTSRSICLYQWTYHAFRVTRAVDFP